MSEKRPYFVWMTEYPDEGSICVDATNPDDALLQGAGCLDDLDSPPRKAHGTLL